MMAVPDQEVIVMSKAEVDATAILDPRCLPPEVMAPEAGILSTTEDIDKRWRRERSRGQNTVARVHRTRS